MFPAPFKIVLDACVLFPEKILEEMRRNLVSTGTVGESQSEALVAVMRDAFPESQVIGDRDLIPAIRGPW